jgi:hypothetical protein
MKIKITEAQAKRLGLINENIDPLSQYEEYCKKMVEKVNAIYRNVINITIDDLIHNTVNMEEINDELNNIESAVRSGSNKAYAYIQNLPEEDLDIRIDRASDLVNDRLTPLQLITMDLERLQSANTSHNYAKAFSDIKPLDITGMQNS